MQCSETPWVLHPEGAGKGMAITLERLPVALHPGRSVIINDLDEG